VDARKTKHQAPQLARISPNLCARLMIRGKTYERQKIQADQSSLGQEMWVNNGRNFGISMKSFFLSNLHNFPWLRAHIREQATMFECEFSLLSL
jgi:hypothetical protein